jgi:hypothetical protein
MMDKSRAANNYVLVYEKVQHTAVIYVRRVVARFSMELSGFDPRSGNLGFVVDKVTMGQVFSV